jgi:hypothetical protein
MKRPIWRRQYCVTVMDNWTPLRYFWTLEGARKWRDTRNLNGPTKGPAHLFEWCASRDHWQERI